jgi:hypothetical protein
MQPTGKALLAGIVLPLLFVGITSHSSMVMAQSAGTFTATGDMATSRRDHTATLLSNGKVLIAGGYNLTSAGIQSLLLSELYDPSSGTFIANSKMTTARVGHTATLLPDGNVLIAGGFNDFTSARGFLANVELYDPSTGTFTPTGQMTAARAGATATLLNNGKVLIAGGSAGNAFLASAELYDPSTETFSATGNMTTARAYPTATLLINGKVLIAGGVDLEAGTADGGAELYNPDSGTFTLAGGTTPLGPFGETNSVTASLLANGKVLATLASAESVSDVAAVYDPSTGTFTVTGNMTAPRVHTATVLPDGTVLIAGYAWVNYGGRPSADRYDPAAGTFSRTGELTTPRFGHTATLLPDGTVLMSGGNRFDSRGIQVTVASAELYHPDLPDMFVPAPTLFSLSGDGQGQGAILHAGTPQVASASNPAVVGEALEIYGVSLFDGSVIPPQVSIGGQMSQILFFGASGGWPGLNQVNVRVPSGVAPGPAVPVRLTYLSRPSNEVTIGVR